MYHYNNYYTGLYTGALTPSTDETILLGRQTSAWINNKAKFASSKTIDVM